MVKQVVKQVALVPCVFQVDVQIPDYPILRSISVCAIFFFHFSFCWAPCVLSQPPVVVALGPDIFYQVPGIMRIYMNTECCLSLIHI